MEKTVVTPYEVKGKIDYGKLVKQFGASQISPTLLKKVRRPHRLLRRKCFYAHRDFDKLLKEKKFCIVSGRGPSASMTLGHLMIYNFIKHMQDVYGCYVFVPFSDDEKFFYQPDLKFKDLKKLNYDNAADIAALGFDPKKTEFFFDTLTMNQEMYNLAVKAAKRMTFSMVKDALGFSVSNNVGSTFYPAMQAAHILYPTVKYKLPVLVVVGIDQDIMIKLARDVAFKLRIGKPADLLSKFIPGLSGSEKMSASISEDAIYTTDSPDLAAKKIMSAFSGGAETLELQKKKGGNPEVCSVFKYLNLFFIDDDKKVAEHYRKCKAGKLQCAECKKKLAQLVKNYLKEHQKRKKRVKPEQFIKK